jgi:8-oxo-dGTP pyrophosphatase MutT (NUDIX family)
MSAAGEATSARASDTLARYQPAIGDPRPLAYDGGMSSAPIRAPLAAVLDRDPRPSASPGDRLAAVLALLVERPTHSLVFTERAGSLSRHAGEVSFPGGLVDPEDRDLAATALRETHEEVGIEPGAVDLLGALPPVHTFVSGILVTPFVGVIPSLPPLRIAEAEIDRVVTVPVEVLHRVEESRELHREGGKVWRGWWYETAEATVWGATGSMVHALLELMRKETPWLTS